MAAPSSSSRTISCRAERYTSEIKACPCLVRPSAVASVCEEVFAQLRVTSRSSLEASGRTLIFAAVRFHGRDGLRAIRLVIPGFDRIEKNWTARRPSLPKINECPADEWPPCS
jgi:hypothetical protein